MAKKKKAEDEVTVGGELDNCPHCGGKAELRVFRAMFVRGWVGCPDCSCYINWSHDPAGAIAKWNKRVQFHVA